MNSFVVALLVGAGQVGEANTGDDTGCGVGEETISLHQVLVCGNDHRGSRSVYVQTCIHCSQHRRRWHSHCWPWRISSCKSFIIANFIAWMYYCSVKRGFLEEIFLSRHSIEPK